MVITRLSGPLKRDFGGLGKGAAPFTAFRAASSRYLEWDLLTTATFLIFPSGVITNLTATRPSILSALAASGYFLFLSMDCLTNSK